MIEDPKHGYLYRLRSRNLSSGVFCATNNHFIGIREKFGNRYLDEETANRRTFSGTATPLEELCLCPIDDLRTTLDTECGSCGAKMKYIHWTKDMRPNGNTLPGEWHHLDKPNCGILDPIAKENRVLFDWIESKTS